MSEFVATSDIEFGEPGRGVYAFRKGQTVPADLVESNGWQDYVSGAGTKAAQQATADVTGDSSPAKATTVAKSSKEG
ncbi:hypothetical protein [Micromonospora maritima]|uniref:hypothetical protein n=1 Tax=Micromonospora maritima TaxID=986711 RepID=UPI00157BEC56|nr:hypothetical protein [Micromonospora maritima]